MSKKASIFAGYATIGIVGTLIVIKAYAYHLSGSVSILSSLTDSVLDSIISIMVLASLFYARRPADSDHRWGHGKIEAVSALFESAIIMGGAVFLILESFQNIAQPAQIIHQEIAITVMVISVFLSLLLVYIQKRSLQESKSLAIEADTANYGGDVLINIGTIVVLYLSMTKGIPLWIDPVFAIFVAGFMIYLARGISIKSLNMLLDRELPEKDRNVLIKIIESHEKVIGWHDLRTHSHGQYCAISFDIEVDSGLSLWTSHAITKDLEQEMLKHYPDSDILIHVDPEGYTEDARHKVKGVHI